jgi:glycosyltransferase involved in cell wall biosynthesis
MRYIWDLHAQYTAEMRWPVKPIFRMVAHWMRLWDFASASRVDEFIANSQFVASRIRKLYRRESTVIHPPVEVQGKTAATGPGEFYLSAGRLVDYKRVDLAVSACRRLGRKLKVVGEGPQLGKLKRIAGEETEFLGRVSDTELPELLSRCRALLFPGEEDFGIVPVEAQAHGRPVIAFASGGALETVIGLRPTELFRADSTGIFFTEQTVDAVVDAIHRFEGFETRFDPQRIHEHALQFDTAIFRARMIAFLLEAVESFDGGRRAVVEADFHSVPL